jgi:enterobacterial common antigen flippase
MAKGRQNLFFWTELAWTSIHIGLALVCLRFLGLNGAGVAFFGSYVFHGFLIYAVVSRLSGFRWSAENIRIGVLFIALIGAVFCGSYMLPALASTCLGLIAALVSGIYSIHVLLTLFSFSQLPLPLRQLANMFRFVPWLRLKAENT